jgi:hypothetical protein
MENNVKKNSFWEDLPFYSFIGMLGISLVGIILYVLWVMIIE